jgi:DNA-binding response OmpR family regulator
MPHVLFVSPNRDEADMYEVGFKVAGCLILTVGDAKSTLAAATEFLFDAAVVSADLRNQQGWRLCQEVRTALPPKTPVLILTASIRADGHHRRQAQSLGYAAFAAKPCPPDALVDLVRRAVSGERDLMWLGESAA